MPSRLPIALAVLVAGCSLVGCGGRDPVTVQLRKDRQFLRSEVEDLRARNAELEARLAAVEVTDGATLSATQLAATPTATDLAFGRLTGLSSEQSLDVYVTPVDAVGDVIKVGGSVKVSVFDLSTAEETALGEWTFDAAELRDRWRSGRLFSGYVVTCPLDAPPAEGAELTVRVQFDDALTGRSLVGVKVLGE
ncbi:MAG: hypothetical protein AAF561_13760 [Planctomycetota bacterium]